MKTMSIKKERKLFNADLDLQETRMSEEDDLEYDIVDEALIEER